MKLFPVLFGAASWFMPKMESVKQYSPVTCKILLATAAAVCRSLKVVFPSERYCKVNGAVMTNAEMPMKDKTHNTFRTACQCCIKY